MIKKVVTIAGSDTWGGGGSSTDLKTFENHHIFGLSVLTSIAVKQENSFTIEALSPTIVKQQLQTLEDTFPLHGVKIGLLAQKETICLVRAFLKKIMPLPLVLDPVFAFKESDIQKESSYIQLLSTLFPFATVVTPNVKEAFLLTNVTIRSKNDLKKAGKRFYNRYHVPCVIKGGHTVLGIDYVYDGIKEAYVTSPYSTKQTTNGAGCGYSSAILAQLVKGQDLFQSVQKSKKYIYEAICQGVSLKEGGNVWHGSK